MKVVHTGFDGIDLAIRTTVPLEFAEFLEKGRAMAQELMRDVGGLYADRDIIIGQSGKRGGYAFTFKIDYFNGLYFAKRPNRQDDWGLFVSIGSRELALHGLTKTRETVEKHCEALGFRIPPDGISINRVDFAVDILVPGFVLNPNAFLFHSRANRRAIAEVETVETNGRSGRTTSVTIGKMPGRQVIVYDKREEAMKRHKHEWPMIWDANLEAEGLPHLDINDPEASQVWRVELRLGKKALRNRHDIRGWGSLHEHLQEEMDQLIQDVTLHVPCGDSNRSRWPLHPIWLVAREAVATCLFAHEARVSPDAVREVDLRVKQQEFLKLIASQTVTLGYLEGQTAENFEGSLEKLPGRIIQFIEEHPRGLEARFAEAAEKYGRLMAK